MEIRFLQYNIAACRNYDMNQEVNCARTLEAIKKFNADIITLNEVDRLTERSGKVDQIKCFADGLGYNSYYAKTIDLQGGEYGVAFLSKYKIISAEQVRIPDTVSNKETGAVYESRTLYSVILDVDGTELRVIGTHYGLTPTEQQKAVDTTLSLFEKSDLPTIFSGDLNIKPDNPLIKRISEKLTDTAFLISPDCISYPSSPEIDNRSMKIDYVFVTSDIKTLEAEIPNEKVSDHKPYFCRLSI